MRNDYHVLNWNQIIDNSNKGIIFENLVEKLIESMFPNETWRRTQKSHDRKRDFVFPADEYLPDEKWAECKNYSDKLSINVIAPTLVMGALDNVKCIYVFSYSELNSNAIISILRYCETLKIKVKIFDGNLLENLICKYHNINGVGDYFKNTNFIKAKETLNNILINVVNTCKNLRDHTIDSNHEFQTGEPFYISTIIRNMSLNTIKCNISFSSKSKNILINNTSNIIDSLEFGEIKEHKIYCHTLKNGSSNISINVKTNFNNGNTLENNYNKSINIVEEPYLFISGNSALNSLKSIIKHLLNYNKKPIIMSSKSGAGKSTIIESILQHKQIQEKYTIVNISLDYLRTHCVKDIFYQIVKVQNEKEIFGTQNDESSEVLYVFLNDYAKSASDIANNIMHLYNAKKPYLFIIDDIQKINRSYVDVLYELNSLSSDENKPIYYLLSLNLDLLSFDDLLKRLNWDSNYIDVKYRHIKINYFDKKDIINFYKFKYGITDIENFFSEFEHEISPLELQSFTIGLKNKGIISYNPITLEYSITDKVDFEKRINEILYSKLAVDSLCSVYENSGIPEYFLKNLWLNGELSLKEWSNYKDIVSELIKNKIIKEENGSIVFKHDKILNSIKKRLIFTADDYVDIFYNTKTNIIAKMICAINGMDYIYDSPSFIKDYFNNSYVIKSNQLLDLCTCIFENLNKFEKYDLTASALNFVCDNLIVLRCELPQMEYYNFMCFVINIIKTTEWDINESCVESISYLIKKYFDRKLSTNNYNDCYDEYLSINYIYTKISNITSNRKHYWLSHFSNRAAVALDKTSDPFLEEPKLINELYELSKYHCKQSNYDVDLLLQINIDDFYRSYSYRHNLTIDIINNCLNELKELNKKKIDRRTCLDYHILLLQYLKLIMNYSNDDMQLRKLIKSTRAIRDQSKSMFYSIKLYQLEIYILINLENLSEANNVLDEALEFAYKKGMRTIIYKFTYIKAILLGLNDSVDKKEYQNNIILAFEQFMDIKGADKNRINHEIFLVYELLRIINSFSTNYISKYLEKSENDISEFLISINSNITNSLCNGESKSIKSSFNFYGVAFPLI